jgi:hypothetical protein
MFCHVAETCMGVGNPWGPTPICFFSWVTQPRKVICILRTGRPKVTSSGQPMGPSLDLRAFSMDDREVVKARLNSGVYKLESAK